MMDAITSPRLSSYDLDIYAERLDAGARENFLEFRYRIRPDIVRGWWIEEVAKHLQQFYEDFIAGRRPKLALMAPPQHGKSWTVEDFLAWISGKCPNRKIIFASYSDELGTRTNLNLQRTMGSELYRNIFPDTRIGEHGWQCNTSLIEFADQRGSFRNTTVNGAINGMELHLGVVDDPVKGRREASSKPTRDATWNWFADDFGSRFSAQGAMLIIMTRWHVDDLLGRFIDRVPGVKVLRYPAIALRDGPKRKAGEALFPEWKPKDFLLNDRRAVLTEGSWQSLYQQSPIIVGGGIFPIEKLFNLPIFDPSMVRKSVRYWDKAGTEDGGAFTAGVLMHEMQDKQFVIGDVVRGQWSALERESTMKQVAQADRGLLRLGTYEIVVEQEPGSGGKESAESTIRNLAGFKVFADKVTGKKEDRAEPFAAQVQGGNVRLIAGRWHTDLLDEMESYPNGRFRDQVDACAGAFNRLTLGPRYNLQSGAFDSL